MNIGIPWNFLPVRISRKVWRPLTSVLIESKHGGGEPVIQLKTAFGGGKPTVC